MTTAIHRLTVHHGVTAAELQSLTQLFASPFNDPNFQLPGATPQQQLQNFVTAISQLNNGQKQVGGVK